MFVRAATTHTSQSVRQSFQVSQSVGRSVLVSQSVSQPVQGGQAVSQTVSWWLVQVRQPVSQIVGWSVWVIQPVSQLCQSVGQRQLASQSDAVFTLGLNMLTLIRNETCFAMKSVYCKHGVNMFQLECEHSLSWSISQSESVGLNQSASQSDSDSQLVSQSGQGSQPVSSYHSVR